MDYFLQNAATGHFQHGETPGVQHPWGALALPGGNPICLAGSHPDYPPSRASSRQGRVSLDVAMASPVFGDQMG